MTTSILVWKKISRIFCAPCVHILQPVFVVGTTLSYQGKFRPKNQDYTKFVFFSSRRAIINEVELDLNILTSHRKQWILRIPEWNDKYEFHHSIWNRANIIFKIANILNLRVWNVSSISVTYSEQWKSNTKRIAWKTKHRLSIDSYVSLACRAILIERNNYLKLRIRLDLRKKDWTKMAFAFDNVYCSCVCVCVWIVIEWISRQMKIKIKSANMVNDREPAAHVALLSLRWIRMWDATFESILFSIR